MAKVHIYVRAQARLSDADAQGVVDLLGRAKAVVEAAGEEWHGGVMVQPEDDEPEQAVASQPEIIVNMMIDGNVISQRAVSRLPVPVAKLAEPEPEPPQPDTRIREPKKDKKKS